MVFINLPTMTPYRIQYSASIPLPWIRDHMKDLIFPDVTKKGDRLQKNFKGVMAKAGDQAVGLVLGLADRSGQNFRVLSLKVSPLHQNRKIATRMMLALEQSLKKEGFQSIDLQYRSHWPTIPVLKKLMTRLAWEEPEFALRICQSLIEQAFPVFHSNHKLPEGYVFTPWREVTVEEKKAIRKRQAAENWYPEDVSPFQVEHIIEPNSSIALRHQDGIVGWLVMHQITPETLEYTALFVDEAHRSFKIGHLLMGEGIHRQAKHGKFPKYLFTVKAENKTMVRFIGRNGAVNGMNITDVFEVRKKLS